MSNWPKTKSAQSFTVQLHLLEMFRVYKCIYVEHRSGEGYQVTNGTGLLWG